MTSFKALHKIILAFLPLLALLAFSTSASATVAAPGFTIDSFAEPTSFSPSEGGTYEVTVTNAGSLPTNGSDITLTDTLPEGLTVQNVSLYTPYGNGEVDLGGLLCSKVPVQCQYPGAYGAVLPALEPDGTLKMLVNVAVESDAPRDLINRATVSGGGAAEASVAASNDVASSPASFGLSNFGFYVSGLDGARDTQAGDHPYEQTTTIGLDNAQRAIGPEGIPGDTSVQDVKDIVVDVPLGFVGSTLAAPECTLAQLSSEEKCPADTVIGHIRTEPTADSSVNSSIYNLVPERGYPAEFGYLDRIYGAHVFYVRVVPTPAGYVLQTTNPDIPAIGLRTISVTFYGDPSAKQGELAEREGKVASLLAPIPFFTNPTECSDKPLVATIYMDSWQNPGTYEADGAPDLADGRWVSTTSESPPVTGCDALQFTPEVVAQPTTHESDTPSGVDFAIKLPQTETVGVPATPVLRKVVETFPPGFTIDPSAGDGLAACSEAQIGWLGGGPTDFNAAEPACPEASKVGELELETPLIPRKLKGEIFLAKQNENPYPEPGHPAGSLVGLYVVVHDPITGVLIKIAGKATLNPNNGQITGEFSENPNLPFSNLELRFFGGPRANFATPESCGMFTTTTELEPWSAPESGLAARPFDSFLIDEACPNGGFNPSFTAGSENLQAGAYTPVVASFERQDTDQELSGLTVALPSGLLADVGSVAECAEAQANAGTCPESSQVGTVQTGVGSGPDPLFVSGKAYLTGPYNGGPFGLSVVVPAVAGPFNFGTVVVRQSIRLNQYTAQVTDVSDPFPKIIDGIPLRLRRVDLTLNREGFMFNPTNCSKLGFNGSITGNQLGSPTALNGTIGYATQAGASKAFTEPFQVTNCATLAFKPQFSSSTSGKPSRSDGTSLDVKLSYPKAPFGSQANVAKVKVELPKQLPARLTTLQKACPDATFNANPATCPPASRVGEATATTPLVPVPLNGPAYFVSHGGAAFPELIVVLSGYGITVDLRGETYISKAGITSSTFNTVPDVPIDTFDLKLPAGLDSALAANGKPCASTLIMPTSFTAQNGATLQQQTDIAVEGCKPTIRVVGHSVKGSRASIRVTAPSAGTLVATGGGIKPSVRHVAKAGTVTMGVMLNSHGQQVLAKNPNQRVNTMVKLLLTPKHGAPLTVHVRLLMG